MSPLVIEQDTITDRIQVFIFCPMRLLVKRNQVRYTFGVWVFSHSSRGHRYSNVQVRGMP